MPLYTQFFSRKFFSPRKISLQQIPLKRNLSEYTYFSRRECGLLLGTTLLSAYSNQVLPTPNTSSTTTVHTNTQKNYLHPVHYPANFGKHIIYSYPGTTVPQELLARIADSVIGGIIFFAENFTSSTHFKDTIDQIHHAALNSKDKKPILLMTDEEGGLVDRIPQGGISEKSVGRAVSPALSARNQGQLHAKLFHTYGLNTNLAPVLGISHAVGDFLDKDERSYSHSPIIVAEAGSAYIREFQQGHLIATAKHFPGLGGASAEANTDERPVIISRNSAELYAHDMFPFRAAIRAGVKAIMPSWALYPHLDPYDCAGMSVTIITQILRHVLDFQGITITDALEAGALSSYGNIAQRAIKAMQAGNDLLCCSQRSIDQGDTAAQAIQKAYREGNINPVLLIESSRRINKTYA